MKNLSVAQMLERQALLMLYAAYTSRMGKCACAKGAFGPEIDRLLENGYAEEACGGYMMTDKGAEHWEVNVTKMSAGWKAMSAVQVAILKHLAAAPKERPWVAATNLPGYQAYNHDFRDQCKHLVKIGLMDKQRASKKLVKYALLPQGEWCLKRLAETSVTKPRQLMMEFEHA